MGRPQCYSDEVVNTLLQGAIRDPYLRVGELFDFKTRKGKTTWGLRNRLIRSLHLLDAPFSSAAFPRGVERFDVEGHGLKLTQR